MSKQLKPHVRRELILSAAIRLARKPGGWSSLTQDKIARESECAYGLVAKYLGPIADTRRAIMARAIKLEYLDIIAQGLASGYPVCLKLSLSTKLKAVSCLMGE